MLGGLCLHPQVCYRSLTATEQFSVGLLIVSNALSNLFVFCSGTSGKQLTSTSKEDGSWGGQVGLLMGLSSSALLWALLSENQDALLTQTINQVSHFISTQVLSSKCKKPGHVLW